MAWGQASCFTGLFPRQALALFATEIGGKLDLEDFFVLKICCWGILEQFAIFSCLGFSFPGKLPTFFFKKQPFYLKFKISGTSKLSKLWWDSWIKLATGKLSNFVMLSRTAFFSKPLWHSIGILILAHYNPLYTIPSYCWYMKLQQNKPKKSQSTFETTHSLPFFFRMIC